MMRPFLRLFAALPLALLCFACEGGGNSGSETTNGLTGVVKDVEGRPVAGARILLLPEEFNPAGSDSVYPLVSARTDGKGAYKLEDLAPGHYHVEISDSAQGTLALIQGVSMGSEGVDTVDGTLGKPGALSVRVIDFLGAGEKGYLYIPGTTALQRLDSSFRSEGAVTLKHLPVGRFSRLVLVLDASADRKIITLAQDLEVLAESTAAVAPFQSWKYARKLAVNTQSAGVKGAVTDFPYLVRLNAGNFDFSQAEPNGQDLRFSQADGTPIPFQIERWNAATKMAEVWARLDTVAGNGSQSFTMHWGRGLTAPDPPGPKVFDSSIGFATVYHLDEPANQDAGGYKDATPNGNDATAMAVNPDSQSIGVIGSAKDFSGAPLSTLGVLTAAMPMGFRADKAFTVSFWVKFKPTQKRQAILDFGTLATLKDMHFLIRADTLSQFGAYDANKSSGADPATWQNVFSLAADVGAWTYVATVYDPAKAVLTSYINGVKVQETATPPLQLDAAGGLRIGKALDTSPGDFPFNGSLDEIRFCNQALSPDRIKLDYESQKP